MSFELGKQLLEVASLGDTLLVKSLIANGAPFTTNWFGSSPLHMAAEHGHVDAAEILLKAGLNIDSKTKVDRTPLQIAAQEGHENVVNLLIRYGADINATDMLSMTALHWAVQNNHLQLVERLLRAGADRHIINKFNKTPQDIARQEGYHKINKVLKETVGTLEEGVAVKSIGGGGVTGGVGVAAAGSEQLTVVDGEVMVATPSLRATAPKLHTSPSARSHTAANTLNTVTKAGRTITIVLTPQQGQGSDKRGGSSGGGGKKPQSAVTTTAAPNQQQKQAVESPAAGAAQKATPTRTPQAMPSKGVSPLSKSPVSAGGGGKEALQWLQTEGQTAMLDDDVQAAPRTLRITKAGEYALEMASCRQSDEAGGSSDGKAAAVQQDTGPATTAPPADTTDTRQQSESGGVSGSKRARTDSDTLSSPPAPTQPAQGQLSPEKMQEELKKLQDEAAAYKLALERKQREADDYKRQLAAGTASSPTASPPASRTSPPASRASPSASRTSPSASRTSPPASRASPSASRTSPSASRTSPAASRTSPSASRASPSASRTSPVTSHTSPTQAQRTGRRRH